jgi:hypothetical protein
VATLRTTLPDLYLQRLAFLEDVIFDPIKIEDGIVPTVIRVREMGSKPFIRTTTVASFGAVPIKPEMAAVAYDELAQGYDKTYQPDTYELAFMASKEALDDEQEEVVSDAGRALGNSLDFTYNVDHAGLFNNGFTSTTGSPDGKALFATDHPLVGGGTGSNAMATPADLSVTSLRTAMNDVFDTVDDAGKLLHWRPRILLVPGEETWNARELVNSTDRPDTASRAINAFRDDPLIIVAWPYLTDSDAWFLLAEPSDHNVRSYWREKPNTMHDWDFERSGMKVKIRARWVRGWSDYRGVYGSTGA